MDQILAILRKYGNTITPEALHQAQGELNALGWHIQNEGRGDVRPRLQDPTGYIYDLGDDGGPWQWVPRWQEPIWDSSGGGGGSGSSPAGDSGGSIGGATPGGDDSGGNIGSVDAGGGVAQPATGAGSILDSLRNTPGYQFAFSEGQRGIQSSAAAKGTLLTGGTLKALAKYGTGLADQTYGEAVNRYQTLADLGARVSVAPF